jgi:hypothetical protein
MGTLKSIVNTNDASRQERQREVITKLKFIGTLQPGEKIDVNNLRIEPNTFFTPLKRMLFGEGRDKTLTFLTLTVERTFEIIQSYIHTERMSERIYCTNIINDVLRAIVGLKNIQETYREDKMFVCNIDTIIETIDAKLTEIRQRHPDLIPTEDSALGSKPTTILGQINPSESFPNP